MCDERGRVCLCLLEESIQSVKSGKVVPPDGSILEKLEKWHRHTVKALATKPVTWVQRGPGKWQSSTGELRMEITSGSTPAASGSAALTEQQLRKQKMAELVAKQAAARQGTASATDAKSDPRKVERQETQNSGKKQRQATADAGAAGGGGAKKSSGKLRSSLAPMLRSSSSSDEVTPSEAAGRASGGGSGGSGGSLPHTLSAQPALLSTSRSLAPHQLIGLNWLLGLHRHRANGILADEMGLGKTVQAIALLARLLEEGDGGPHMIVAPTSVIENWRRELQMWCPALRVLVYTGPEAERATIRDEVKYGHGERGASEFEVLLTSYALFSSSTDSARRERMWLSKRVHSGYLVLDEAQQIKNSESARYRSLSELQMERRLLLTGTPVENSPKELLSLLSFLVPKLFATTTKDSFHGDEKKSKKAKKEAKRREGLAALFESLNPGDAKSAARAKKIRNLIGPFVLRRLKSQVLDALPPKTETVTAVELTPSQAAVYGDAVTRIAAQHREREASQSLSSDFISSSFTLLRKAAHHPMLLPLHYASDPPVLRRIARVLHGEGEYGDPDYLDFEKVLAEVQAASDLTIHLHCLHYPRLHEHALPPAKLLDAGKMRHLAQLLPELRRDGHRALIFSQWTMVLDLIALALEHLEIGAVRFDGSTDVAERQRLIDEFNKDTSITAFLLSTRAGGVGINLTSADTVIIYDSDWNPASDKQAMDRCHRMGQTRPVTVLKLAAKGTVDERIVQIAKQKDAQQKALLFGDGGGGGIDSTTGSGDGSGDGGGDLPQAALLGAILRETIFPGEAAVGLAASPPPSAVDEEKGGETQRCDAEEEEDEEEPQGMP